MIEKVIRLLSSATLALCAANAAMAGTVSGVVRNGTSGQPAAGVEVILLRLQGGMEALANTKTDAEGRYHFENAAVGQQPMLIRVVYRGVMFHQPLPPGRNTADVEVFDPTTNPKAIELTSRLIVLQPNGASLLVGEEYTVQNQTKPSRAYYDANGDFNFVIPDGADLSQVSAWGPSGMPVVQGTIDRGSHRYAIAFAFQPGENGVRVSYQLPYSSNQASLRLASSYAAQRVLLVVPPTMRVSSPGFQPAGNEQGYNVYARDAVAEGTWLDVSVSGTAPPPSAGDQQGQDQVNGRDSGVPIQALPGRLDSLKWVLVGGFASLFFLGMLFLWRRPVTAPAAAAVSALPEKPSGGARAGRRAEKRPPAASAAVAADDIVVEAKREINQSLDGLKDLLFRLELRRQAGTISEEEYARERSRAEKALRDLVKG